MHYVYIITNQRNGTLYIGATNDLNKRIWEHRNKVIPGFSQKYNLTKLVYYEVFNEFYDSRNREAQLKKWKRLWKLELIEKLNPEWADLYDKL
jgi:putative endonuclease